MGKKVIFKVTNKLPLSETVIEREVLDFELCGTTETDVLLLIVIFENYLIFICILFLL